MNFLKILTVLTLAPFFTFGAVNVQRVGGTGADASDLTTDLTVPAGKMLTVTGTLSGVDKTDVGLSNVDNTSDANKPVSAATQTALNAKAPLASPTFTGTPILPTGTLIQIPGEFPITTVSFGSTTEISSPVEFTGTVSINNSVGFYVNQNDDRYFSIDATDGAKIQLNSGPVRITTQEGLIALKSTDIGDVLELTLQAGQLLLESNAVNIFSVSASAVDGSMVVNTFEGDSDRLISTNGDGYLDVSLIPTTDIVVAIQRGTDADRLLDTPDAGVLIWTTDKHEAWIGEASTVGGIPFTPPGYEFAPGGDEDHINITTPDSVSNMYLGTQTFEINMVSDHLTWADGVSFTLDSAEINLVVGSHSIYITEDTSGMTGDTLSLNAPGIGQIQINGDAGVTIESEVGYEVNLSSSESIALNGPVFVNGALRLSRVTTATSYTVIGTDYLVAVTSTAAARTISLPSVGTAGVDGRHLVIKDESGGAGTNNITIDPNGSELIDGAATKSITTNYGVMRIYSNGTAWFTE